MTKLLPLSAAQNLLEELLSCQPVKHGPKRSQAVNIANWYAINREGKPFNDADRDDYIARRHGEADDKKSKTRVSEWGLVRTYLRGGTPAYDTRTARSERAPRDTSSASISSKILAHPSVTSQRRDGIRETEANSPAPIKPPTLVRGIVPPTDLAGKMARGGLDPKMQEKMLYIAVMTGFGANGEPYDDQEAKQAIVDHWETDEWDSRLASGHFMGGLDHEDSVYSAVHDRLASGRWGYVAYFSLLNSFRSIIGQSRLWLSADLSFSSAGVNNGVLSVRNVIDRLDEAVLKNGITPIDLARPRAQNLDYFERCLVQFNTIKREPSVLDILT